MRSTCSRLTGYLLYPTGPDRRVSASDRPRGRRPCRLRPSPRIGPRASAPRRFSTWVATSCQPVPYLRRDVAASSGWFWPLPRPAGGRGDRLGSLSRCGSGSRSGCRSVSWCGRRSESWLGRRPKPRSGEGAEIGSGLIPDPGFAPDPGSTPGPGSSPVPAPGPASGPAPSAAALSLRSRNTPDSKAISSPGTGSLNHARP